MSVTSLNKKALMIESDSTLCLLCDMQEKFRPAISFFPEILTTCNKLVKCLKILEIPLIATEQYPKGLGSTVEELDISHAVGIFPKTKFSMVIPEIEEHLQNISTVILFGLEAHVCVEQTAIELMLRGINVHVVADATSSRSQEDRLLSFQRLRQAGCCISTSESIIFKLLKDKNHPQFNEVRKLVSQASPNTGL
ncbi:Isochorismatase domain-containing protein 1 [Nymphon striatum]|nr:Isochorismatase domain-containing protein 1 [Nymphon striatum]